MAYIGQQGGVTATITSKTLDTMTGDGSDTTLTLSQTPTSAEDVSIYADGVYQRPTNEYTVSGDVVTFTTAPASGVFVCAVTGGGHHIGSPMAGSVSTSKIIDGTITNAMVATMSSSKLTGALGALDGSALTGLPSSIMKNASDPAIDTNPSGGVGSVWANTTDGEMFVCTDATTDANVWYNVGAGTGDIGGFSLQASISGYTMGGSTLSAGGNQNIIDKFSFTSDGNATDVGDLTASKREIAGQSSATHAYQSGGGPAPSTAIEKFSFSVGGNATSVASLSVGRSGNTGTSSETHGYNAGGEPNIDVIDKFVFATDSDATDVGNLSQGRHGCGGNSSTTHGYASSGFSSGAQSRIDKYSFSSDGDASNIANATARWNVAGSNSTTHGYLSGGYSPPDTNVIEKFTFASDANTTDVGDLTSIRNGASGTSTETHGYVAGGTPSNNIGLNNIEKFTFASDANTTDVGDLTVARAYAAPAQV